MGNTAWKELTLPREVYFQCIWIIKDMDRLNSVAMRRMSENSREDEFVLFVDEMSRSIRDEVVDEAYNKLSGIKRALDRIPEEYRDGIIANIKDAEEPRDIAHPNTWKYWKKRFIYSLADSLNLY